jgi:hypothetical protein
VHPGQDLHRAGLLAVPGDGAQLVGMGADQVGQDMSVTGIALGSRDTVALPGASGLQRVVPDEFAEKALRYGWPAGAAYLPLLVGVGSDGASDLAGADAQRLQMALAAVLAIDSRGPVLAEGDLATTGRVALADGAHGDFVVMQ